MRFIAFVLSALAGCAHPVEPTGVPAPEPPYAALHAAATRDLQLIVNLETRLMMHATLVDEQLAQAQALEISRARLEAPAVWQARADAAQREAAAAWTVVFSADVPRAPADESFAPDDTAAWTLHLFADGHEVPAISVEQIDDPQPEHVLLYPQLNRWSSLWIARFARDGDARELRLQVGGPKGQGELAWTL